MVEELPKDDGRFKACRLSYSGGLRRLREVFFDESEAQMSRGTNCFDLFEIFSNALRASSQRLGRIACEDAQSQTWLAFCDENRAQHCEQQRGSAGVKKSRPVAVRELAIVRSCKRKVRW